MFYIIIINNIYNLEYNYVFIIQACQHYREAGVAKQVMMMTIMYFIYDDIITMIFHLNILFTIEM